ncbi:helix-turn-helix transcriptional regulator [Brevundimonas sp.]|uniref:helix-turn-helix transcriptional regulator n=1 Tax=Brevundimonas sp. TaxID=1871086 RepID=UPI003F728F6E
MLRAGEDDGLVSHFYASAMGDTPWTATLERLTAAFGGQTAVLSLRDAGDETFAVESHGASAEYAAAAYASEVLRNDPRMPCFFNAPKGRVYFDHALFDVEEMHNNPLCRESDAMLGTRFQLGVMTDLPGQVTATVGVMRTAEQGHACEADIAAFRRLAPHVEQALALGQVIELKATTQSILLEALARKADGVILLDRAGAPSFMNDAARVILAAGDGLAWGVEGFVTDRGPETLRLGGLIQSSLDPAGSLATRRGGQMPVHRRSGRHPYVLSVIPVPPQERFLSGHRIAGVIHIQDLATVALPSHETLAAVFGLSEREADLVVELIRCPGLGQASAQAGMALNTARNHLHSIFLKSNTTSQAEMIQMLGRLL